MNTDKKEKQRLEPILEILELVSLYPRLLTGKEEEQFRETFKRLYPVALHHLRNTCPKITRSEELLCMLIALNLSNEEMARTLGISRPSVLQARYRLRSKLALSEGSDLNTEVRKILIMNSQPQNKTYKQEM